VRTVDPGVDNHVAQRRGTGGKPSFSEGDPTLVMALEPAFLFQGVQRFDLGEWPFGPVTFRAFVTFEALWVRCSEITIG